MNENKPSHPADPDISPLIGQVTSAVRAQKRTMGVLTGAAFSFGFATIIASVFIVAVYLTMYLPKQKHLLHLVAERSQGQSADVGKNAPANDGASKAEQELVRTQVAIITMTHALGLGIMMISVAVGLLAVGTVVTLTLVVVQRRATLNHINISLAQISGQLKELQPSKRPT